MLSQSDSATLPSAHDMSLEEVLQRSFSDEAAFPPPRQAPYTPGTASVRAPLFHAALLKLMSRAASAHPRLRRRRCHLHVEPIADSHSAQHVLRRTNSVSFTFFIVLSLFLCDYRLAGRHPRGIDAALVVINAPAAPQQRRSRERCRRGRVAAAPVERSRRGALVGREHCGAVGRDGRSAGGAANDSARSR